MKKEVVIFCQAPSDIQYLLTLYEKLKNTSLINVYVVNVENMFHFISSLNLNLNKCIFIPYSIFSLKNPIDLIKEKYRIKKIILNNFKKIENNTIYFFSIYEDWLTATFIKYLSKNNKIFYLDYYDFSANIFDRKKLTFRLQLQKISYWLITGISFQFQIREKIPEFNFLKYKIIKQYIDLDTTIFDKYQYRIIENESSKKNIILFISPCEDAIFDHRTYNNIQLKVISTIKKYGWNIYIKGHPRIGTPENITKFADVEIPSYIPAEFINLNGFKLVFGIITSSLAHFALNTEINTYTLINIFDFVDKKYKKIYIEYLLKLSKNRIQIIENTSQLSQIINQ